MFEKLTTFETLSSAIKKNEFYAIEGILKTVGNTFTIPYELYAYCCIHNYDEILVLLVKFAQIKHNYTKLLNIAVRHQALNCIRVIIKTQQNIITNNTLRLVENSTNVLDILLPYITTITENDIIHQTAPTIITIMLKSPKFKSSNLRKLFDYYIERNNYILAEVLFDNSNFDVYLPSLHWPHTLVTKINTHQIKRQKFI